jgi:SAM-dependent methyltransferase
MAPQFTRFLKVGVVKMEYDEAALQAVRERRLLIDRCDAWLFDTIRPFLGQRILEVGCGLGNLLPHLTGRELAIGVDVAEDSVSYVNGRYEAHDHVQAFTVDVTDRRFVEELHGFQCDTAVSLNVLEHIEDDVQALKHIHEVLTDKSTLVLIVPAHSFLFGTMDSSIGHYRRYDKANLAAKLEQTGFNVLLQRYINPLGALGWFANGRVLRRRVPPVEQLKLFNMLMPFVATLDKLVDNPFGLSLLSVAKKR